MWRMAAVIGSSVWVLGASPAEAGLFGGPPWSYIAEPIEGRVVDQATGQPIEGAVVVAQWLLAKPPEGHPTERWVVIEAVTDAEGRYQIPGWGPKRRPWFRWLTGADPELVVFKSGYWFDHLQNAARGAVSSSELNARGDRIRKTYWNGKDIVLWPFTIGAPISEEWKVAHRLNPYPEAKVLTEAEWADRIGLLQTIVGWYATDFGETQEDWLKIQHLVNAINQECLRLPHSLRHSVAQFPPESHAALFGGASPC